ncbi:hypothetical protein GX48_00217 [Paracoccidioides brasiliensis]|nr:hypothetical protein GX48_00217 [Paracoccidioides brasiliensis]
MRTEIDSGAVGHCSFTFRYIILHMFDVLVHIVAVTLAAGNRRGQLCKTARISARLTQPSTKQYKGLEELRARQCPRTCHIPDMVMYRDSPVADLFGRFSFKLDFYLRGISPCP